MKTGLMLLLILFNTIIYSQEQGTTIKVSVNNIAGTEGTVQFGLYTQETFMVAPPLQSAEGTIEEGKTTVTFNNIEPGNYAVLCYYDKNDNKQMDFDTNGMPLESYGSSNNNMTMDHHNGKIQNLKYSKIL
ncbi:DUF2141 domain-containing protein [Leeuwenhoekiella sp. A16]|uniref:DUF2141 domain-containing protein n=1 Tax=Leeuwenhoekiella sp. A16 TaxID=3141462 RepID=UPI003A80031F